MHTCFISTPVYPTLTLALLEADLHSAARKSQLVPILLTLINMLQSVSFVASMDFDWPRLLRHYLHVSPAGANPNPYLYRYLYLYLYLYPLILTST